MNKAVFIYGLKDPGTNLYFCVGSTIDPKRRQVEYIKGRSSSMLTRRVILDMQKKGVQPRFVVLEECDSQTRDDRELHWIRKLRTDGHPLVNMRKPMFRVQRKY